MHRTKHKESLVSLDVVVTNCMASNMNFNITNIKENTLDMDSNVSMNVGNSSQDGSQDPRILAMSYMMYKIGKYSY